MEGTVKEPQEDDDLKGKVADFKAKHREWERSDLLVKGWIFGSVSEDVMRHIDCHATSNSIWGSLRLHYGMTRDQLRWNNATTAFDEYIPLYRAIELEDWETAQEIFSQDKSALTCPIAMGENALRAAISCKHASSSFLENLLNQIEIDDDDDGESLRVLYNALQFAIMSGNKVAVEKLVHKAPRLLFDVQSIRTPSFFALSLPLEIAAIHSHRTIFDYLFEACKEYIGLTLVTGCRNPFKGIYVHMLLASTIKAEYYDFAYDLLKHCYHELDTDIVDGPNSWRSVYHLAEKPDAFRSAKRYNFYQKFVYSRVSVENCSLGNTPKNPDIENQEKFRSNLVGWKSSVCHVMERICVKFWEFAVLHVPHIKSIQEDKAKHNKVLTLLKLCCEKNAKIWNIRDGFEDALILAVKNEIPEILEQITRFFPLSIRKTREDRYTLYQLSIINRCEKSYNFLVYEATYHKDLHHKDSFFEDIDKNLLYLAAKLVPDDKLNKVTGAGLQMQRELQWFKEISKIVPPEQMKSRNMENNAPMMVFKREHKDLRQKGEDWMKQTAGSYTITAALIITMVFPAIITVPGGNNGETRRAIYKDKLSFMIYCYSVWISFFTSTTSLLLFLSILTERYAEEDFLKRLPKRLIFGLVTLFMSVTTMVISYSAAFYIMSVSEHEKTTSRHLVPICLMTSLPIASFVTLQLPLPLLVDLISSTYGRGTFGNQRELRKTT